MTTQKGEAIKAATLIASGKDGKHKMPTATWQVYHDYSRKSIELKRNVLGISFLLYHYRRILV